MIHPWERADLFADDHSGRSQPAWRVSKPTLQEASRNSDQATGVPVRYVKDYPGEMLHVDFKRLGRILDGGGRRLLGEDFRVRRGGGYDYVHVAVDDFSRVGFAEVFPDHQGASAATFLLHATALFAECQHDEGAAQHPIASANQRAGPEVADAAHVDHGDCRMSDPQRPGSRTQLRPPHGEESNRDP